MRASLLLVMLVAGCAVDAPPEVSISPQALDSANLQAAARPARRMDVCLVAAELPADELCAHICDPDAMQAQLVAGGEAPGTCVELRCDLPDSSSVVVGICVPPN